MICRKHAISAFFLICLCALVIAVSGQQPPSGGAGALIVLSDPVGADILLNDKPMGTSPLRIINIPAATYRLTVMGSERKVFDSTVTVAANAAAKISVVLQPAEIMPAGNPAPSALCTLIVKTTPPGATLFVNNQPAGVTPFTNDTLLPGSYHLRLELAGYESMEGTVELRAGEAHPVEKTMTAKPGAAAATATALPSGTLARRGVVPAKDSAASLARAKAALALEPVVKKGSHGGRTARRWIFDTLAAAAGGTAWYFDTRVAAAVDEQEKILAEYHAAKSGFSQYETRYNSAGKTAKDKAQVRNILYGAAGGWGLLFLISIPF